MNYGPDFTEREVHCFLVGGIVVEVNYFLDQCIYPTIDVWGF